MRSTHLQFTIGRMMTWVAISVIVIGPIARYASASPEGREWWEKMAWLVVGIALILVTIAAPYLAGFWEEFRDRRQK